MGSRVNGIIYIDGPDGAGKTTLANAIIRKNNGGVILHATFPAKRNDMLLYHTALLHRATRLSAKTLVILDRHWLSETVYSEVYRGGTLIPHEGRIVDRVLLKHAAPTILCSSQLVPATQRHAKLCRERPEKFTTHMGDVVQKFLDIMDGVLMKTPDYRATFSRAAIDRPDIWTYSIEAVLSASLPERVLAWMDSYQAMQYKPALDPRNQNVLGHLTMADYLFVGDAVNPVWPRLRWPFYEHANCSLYLAQVLHELNFDESRAMWTNVNCDEQHVTQILEAKPLKVIAMGALADRSLNKLGVKHVLVNHPQFARRFMRNSDDYKTQLRAALQLGCN